MTIINVLHSKTVSYQVDSRKDFSCEGNFNLYC